MADVRINGRRIPALQAIDSTGTLLQRLDAVGQRNRTVLTDLSVNNRQIDPDSTEIHRLKLEASDTIEARMESVEQLAFESLQVAQEMAELLAFDLKVVTLHLWDNSRLQEKSLETLLTDCTLFLSLGARPYELLGHDPLQLPQSAQECLRQLDAIAHHVEDATLLAVTGSPKDACHVLVARVIPTLERWLGLTPEFAEHLQIDRIEMPTLPGDLFNHLNA